MSNKYEVSWHRKRQFGGYLNKLNIFKQLNTLFKFSSEKLGHCLGYYQKI